MLLRTIAYWEASFHGMELVPGLDLCRSQHHRRAMMNTMEGNLLNEGRDVLETSGDGGTLSIDGVCGSVRR